MSTRNRILRQQSAVSGLEAIKLRLAALTDYLREYTNAEHRITLANARGALKQTASTVELSLHDIDELLTSYKDEEVS